MRAVAMLRSAVAMDCRIRLVFGMHSVPAPQICLRTKLAALQSQSQPQSEPRHLVLIVFVVKRWSTMRQYLLAFIVVHSLL